MRGTYMRAKPKCPLIFDDEFTAKEWNQFTRPCIYAWFRPPNECLYVGYSLNGISRPLSNTHHVIGQLEAFLPDDFIRIFYPPTRSKEDLLRIEAFYIKTLNPRLNTIRYDKPTKKDLQESEVQPRVSTKETLAGILLHEMQNNILLDDPRNYSETELREYIARLQQAVKITKNHPDIVV